MTIRFVTGSNAAFFNSLLVCLQSFAERLPEHRLLVCDYGLTAGQAKFLDGIGVLLARPPELAGRGVFHCKAGLLRYFQHGGHEIGDDDCIIWLDADLTLMAVEIGDFQAVIDDMKRRDLRIAACAEPAGRTIEQMISFFGDSAKMAPFAQMATRTGIDCGAPYLSSGVFFCRSTGLLNSWSALTDGVAEHPLFEQNAFNVAIRRDAVPLLTLDCEEWQAQGHSLDAVSLVASEDGGRPAAHIDGKNIKTLHGTSPDQGHLLIANCRMTVHNLDLTGPFKLFMAEPLRVHQLQLLASFMVEHGEALLRLRICTPAARPAEGFQFATL